MENIRIPGVPTQFIHRPPDLDENQCKDVIALVEQIIGGSLEGATNIVICYQMSPEEFASLQNNGHKLYLSFIGGVAPHMITTSLSEATFQQHADT